MRLSGYRKRRPGAPANFFAAEAAGLRWLAVPGGARVVSVLEVGPEHIEVERVPPASPSIPAAEDFGRALAVTHDAGAAAFGAGPDGLIGDAFIGDAPLPLVRGDDWGGWFAEHRVLYYARRAQRALPDGGLELLERVAGRLAAGVFDDDAPPARIHGDLWSGNVLYSPAGVALIDPAAHGGHRITDLAMLSLFGTPHLARMLGAYAEASGSLPDGWRDLIGLHQLHPLLVHAMLFGAGYGTQAVEVAGRYL